MSEFPATNLLGYSMDMSSVTPLDTMSATKAIQNQRRIISFDEDSTRQVTIDGKTYNVPKSIGVLEDKSVTTGFVHYSNGNEASVAFRSDSTLASRFMSITGDASVGRATEKHHRKNLMYAYFCFGQAQYLAVLKNYADLLDENSLKKGLKTLPVPFNGENKENLASYKKFFQRYGTHVVTKVQSGAHYSLHLWSPTTNTSVNPNWAANIKADYEGIPSSGEYDASVRNSDQYKAYLNLKQRIESVYGGDNNKSLALGMDPTWKAFQDWVATSQQNPSILSFVVDELLDAAFHWIVDNPAIYKTSVSLVIESDWAEFGLLTPSAVIIKGDTVPTNTTWDETKFTWGKEHSHEYRRQTVVFYVINDGYPIDFYISHGSLQGNGSGRGTAKVTMESKTYENNDITDDVWNTKWFYQAGVTGTPENFNGNPQRTPNSGVSAWDSVLKQFLSAIGQEPKPKAS
ncbi:hypothetical protein AAF712_000370 [Marasmius tenuissimus]|uniref:MACPF domain-containing protein n=1 Tax=Marasmius tenuissimus TaxID=585030 RepID=A0ABR3AGV5_9AGAR